MDFLSPISIDGGLTLGAGDTVTPPLTITSSAGVVLATPLAGAMEYDGTSLYFTPSTTRQTFAYLDSPAFINTPTAPTAAVDTNSTQLATTAFVVGQASTSNPLMNGSVAVGTSLRYAREDHVHASDTSRAPLASPTFTGTVTMPAGTASIAPLKLTSGTNLTTPAAGSVEYDGTNLYFTPSSARKTIAFTDSNLTGTAANVTGTVAIANGGTGQTTAVTAFDALSPLTTLGDIIYHNGTDNVRLAGNTVNSKRFLIQTGTGTVSAAPSWGSISAADVPGSALTKTDDTNVTLTLGGSASTALLNTASITVGWSGTLAATRGGTGTGSYTVGDILYADTTTTLAKRAAVASGSVLASAGVGTAPTWSSAITLSTSISAPIVTASGMFIATGNGSLPAAAGSNIRIAGGYASPVIGRVFIGDGSGWRLHFSSRTGSADTDRITFKDTGEVGIGNTNPTYLLDLAETSTNAATADILIRSSLTMNPASASSATAEAIRGSIILDGSANNFTARNSGGYFSVSITGTGTVTRVDALTANFSKSTAGTVTNWAGLRVESPSISTGTITSAYGIYIESQDTGSQVTAGYGVYQASAGDFNIFAGPVNSTTSIGTYTTGDGFTRCYINSGGTIAFGPGNATQDIFLYRNNSTTLKTDNNFLALGSVQSASGFGVYQTGDSQFRGYINNAGTILWGPGGTSAQDVNLYRSAADILKTDDTFAAQNIQFPTTRVASSDANNLDWYYEGSYTPTVNNNGTATIGTRLFRYIIIGKLCFVYGYLSFTATGSGTAQLSVTLPTTPLNVTIDPNAGYSSSPVFYSNLNTGATAVYNIIAKAEVVSTSHLITFYKQTTTTATGTVYTALTGADLKNLTTFDFSISFAIV